jgi:hypothetical protein
MAVSGVLHPHRYQPNGLRSPYQSEDGTALVSDMLTVHMRRTMSTTKTKALAISLFVIFSCPTG